MRPREAHDRRPAIEGQRILDEGRRVSIQKRRVEVGSNVSHCIGWKSNTLSAVNSALATLDTTHWLGPMIPSSRTTH